MARKASAPQAPQIIVGENVQASLTGTVLTLTVDLAQNIGPSKRGKVEMIATTNHGLVNLHEHFENLRPVVLGLSVFHGREQE